MALDIPAVPISEEQIQSILAAREPRDEILSVPTSVAFGEEKRFIMYGDTQEYKEYATAQEMIQAEPPLPDPVFAPDDFCPCTYDVGAPLDRLDAHDAQFKEMIKEMFEAGPELKLTKEGIEEQIAHYEESTAEITLPMVENE